MFPPRNRLAPILLGLLLLIAGASAAPVRAEAPAHPAAAPAQAEGSGEGQIDILRLEFPLAIWSVIVFFTLLFVLGKYAWKPLLKALHEREENLEHTLRETEHARSEAERLMAEHRTKMAQAADEVRAILEQGRRDAEAVADEIRRKAKEESDSARERSRREIGSARDQALQEIWNRTADLAVSVAGKVLERELGTDDRRRLVEVAMHELPDRPAGTNGHGGQPA